MIRNTDILIQRLKLQPVQGMPTNINQRDADKAKLNTELTKLGESAKDGLGDIQAAYLDVYEAFNKTQLSLQTGISKMTGVFDSYATAMIALTKEATFLEQRNAALNKTFGITSTTAAALGQAYDEMAETLGTGGEKIRKFGQNVNAILPGMSKMIMGVAKAGQNFKSGFNTQLLGTNQLLTEHMGLTSEVANNYQLYAAGAGASSLELLETTREWATAFDEATGMAGSFATAVSEIANLSSDIQMTYKRYPGNLEKAVIKAKLLGTEFGKIEAMATKMLDIESSVGQELEYQLLSGKRLVNQQGESITENLRIAKLTGNAEDQVKAMNDLLTTQGDILDGNNYYAKKQLADLSGFTIEELTRQRQTRKLMEEGGMTETELNDILNKDPKDFAKALEGRSESEQKLLSNLMSLQSQKTTDQKAADFYDKERTQGIKVMAGDQVSAITGAAAEATAAQGAAAAYGKQFLSPVMAQTLGKTQLLGEIFDATLKPVEGLTKMLPVANTALNTFVQNIKDLKNAIAGQKGASGRTEPETTTTPVKDGILSFDPSDKFTLLASTERGQLNTAVNTLTSNNNGTAVVDPGPIAAAIMSALSSMKVEVNYDVVAAQKAIDFKFNQSIN